MYDELTSFQVSLKHTKPMKGHDNFSFSDEGVMTKKFESAVSSWKTLRTVRYSLTARDTLLTALEEYLHVCLSLHRES